MVCNGLQYLQFRCNFWMDFSEVRFDADLMHEIMSLGAQEVSMETKKNQVLGWNVLHPIPMRLQTRLYYDHIKFFWKLCRFVKQVIIHWICQWFAMTYSPLGNFSSFCQWRFRFDRYSESIEAVKFDWLCFIPGTTTVTILPPVSRCLK